MKNTLRKKDNLISKVLVELSKLSFSDSLVLKGGTSLSKGHKFGNRLSEDIDLHFITDVSGSVRKKCIKEIKSAIERVAEIQKQNPEGDGIRTHIKLDLLDKNDKSTSVNCDIRIEKPIDYFHEHSKAKIFEFNEEFKQIEVDGCEFNVPMLTYIFIEKAFAFQNNAYTVIAKNRRGIGRRYSKLPIISDNERKQNELALGEIKRLARHAYDITVIWKTIKSIDINLVAKMMGAEAKSKKATSSNYLKYIYENNKFSSFLIFNSPDVIRKWLKEMKEDFIVSIDFNLVIKELESIKRDIKKIEEIKK